MHDTLFYKKRNVKYVDDSVSEEILPKKVGTTWEIDFLEKWKSGNYIDPTWRK